MNTKVIIFGVFFLLIIILFSRPVYAEQQISQFGITWSFDRDYQVGRFANGDHWVVGPVTITGINPPSTKMGGRTINGSMVNPSPKLGRRQGYDSTMYGNYGSHFDPSLNVGRPNDLDLSPSNPLVLKPNSSLVSTISISEAGQRPQLRTAAILTVLTGPAAEGSFRPPYCGNDKTIRFNIDKLDYSLLAKLKPVPTVPGLAGVERYFERPWIDHIPDWTGRYHHPKDNMPDYYREISTQVGIGALMLHINFSDKEKETLLIRYVQLGIDFYGTVKGGSIQDRSKRKWPILFAGIMLDDSDMKNVDVPDNISFKEDGTTFYVSDDDIYEPPYEKHNFQGFVYYGHGSQDKRRDLLEYGEHHHGMPEWGIRHVSQPISDGLNWDAPYRGCCTANGWAGFVLAVHLMGAKEIWNHDALFDYMDRYMQVEAAIGRRGHWKRQRSRFAEDMWDYYRPRYGPVWAMTPVLNVTASGGSVNKAADKAGYKLGETVTLRAIADAGYKFERWSGDLAGAQNPVRVIMHANKNITAHFAPNDPHQEIGSVKDKAVSGK
jgi:hypothetical protein